VKAQHWEISECSDGIVEALQQSLSLSELASRVLSSRGCGLSEASALLNGELQNELCDPMMLADIIPAIETFQDSVEKGELICVYGDYDCDGVAATAMMKSYLESIGARSCYYIPQREKEGYGLNNAAIADLRRMGVDLIITVDNGISAIEEIDYANSLGMRVIVTDHHRPKDVLPAAAAVIDPHRSDCSYPFKELSGVGVAFKFLAALEGERGEYLLEQYADLLTIGTVADVVSLTGENRCFVKRGLELMEQSDRAGIRAVLRVAGIEGKKLGADSIAFGIAPRVNAAGRLDSAEMAVELLLSENEEEAFEVASHLDSLNSGRKNDEKVVTDDIARQIESAPGLLNRRILVFSGSGWNAGIVGIVCSRLVERFGKPCLLIAINGDDAKGSGRSIEGFSLINAITACSHLLTRYGGHPMAAGFSLKTDDIKLFSDCIESFAKNNYDIMPAVTVKIDCEVEPGLMTVDQVKSLDCLEPFGANNPQPVFMITAATLEKVIPLSEGKHCKLRFVKNGIVFNVVCFFVKPQGFCASAGDVVDVAFTASINEYQGQKSVSLKFKAIRMSDTDTSALVVGQQKYECYLRGENLDAAMIPTRDETAVIYRYLKSMVQTDYSPNAIYCHLAQKKRLDYLKFRIALDVMGELDLIRTELRQGIKTITVNLSARRVSLDDSSIIRSLQQQL